MKEKLKNYNKAVESIKRMAERFEKNVKMG